MGNYAFIDGNNIHLGIKDLSWEVDYKRFRIYLKDKYNVVRAYYFIGYVAKNKNLYDYLKKSGYELIFKPTVSDSKGLIKGNCDAELVLQAMIDYDRYEKAVIVTSDGDFACLLVHLRNQNKLRVLLAPDSQKCSILLKKEAKNNIAFMHNLEQKIGVR